MAGDVGDPEPPQGTAEAPPEADSLSAEDFDVTYKAGHPFIPQIEGYLDTQSQFRRFLDLGYSPAEAVGALDLIYTEFPLLDFDFTWYNLSREELTRLYLYRELAEMPDYEIAERLEDEAFRDALGVDHTASDHTIKRLADEVAARDRTGEITNIQSLLRDLDEIPPLFDEPPSIEGDGIGPPKLVELTREMRQKGYGSIQLGREEPRFPKWEVFKPYEVAANSYNFLNDTQEALQYKPYYYSRDAPHNQIVWNCLREYSRSERRMMFLCAYEQLLRSLMKANLIPDRPDIAIDLTDWQYFGTPGKLKNLTDRPPGVEGTKPGRNYSYAFQLASVSFTNVEVPYSIAARAVSFRKNRDYHLKRLLNYAEAIRKPEVVCIDGDFYTDKVSQALKRRDYDFIMWGGKAGSKLKDELVMGAYNTEDNTNSRAWEIGADRDDPEREMDHYLFVLPSEKRLRLADTGLADLDNWDIYYSSINPKEYDGGCQALQERYRMRWAIETEYRIVKEQFLPKSASTLQEKREFLFQLALLYDAMWRAANCEHAVDIADPNDVAEGRAISPKDDQGRYHYTAFQFMTAMVDDVADIDIGEIHDLSARSDIVRYCAEDDI